MASDTAFVQYHLDMDKLGQYTVLPPLVQAGVGGVSGVLADWLVQRGVKVKSVRRWLQVRRIEISLHYILH